MLSLEPLHNIKLEVYEPDGIATEVSVKNYLLFSKVDDEICAFMCERYIVQASNLYTKLNNKYPLYMLDEDSYDRLYNRFLELRTDKAIETMQEDQEEDIDEFSLTDFLRTSSDILTSEESAPIIKFVNALFIRQSKRGLRHSHRSTGKTWRSQVSYRRYAH